MSAVLKRYSEYRSAELPWLERCPSHWKTVRPKSIFRRMQRPVRPEDEVVTCFRDGMVTLRNNRRTTGFTEALQEIGYQGIRKGDLVIHAMDAFAGAIGVSDSDGKGTPVYAVCQPSPEADAHYYAFILREMSRSEYLLSLAKGIRERSTDFRYGDFAALEVPMPPRDEQAQIVRFIRHLDQRVNRLIKTKRRLIELLNEQKQAIIHSAVTRGLDPTVPLKSSGIEWLGDINTNWQALRSKYLFREVDERSPDGAEEHLSMSQVHGLIPSSQIGEKRLVSESYAGGKVCREGDLVLNRLKAHLGVFALAPTLGVISPDYTVLRPIADIEERFFELVYRTPACIVELTKRAKGIVQGFWRLYTDDFYCIVVPVPPRAEQRQILEWLDAEHKTLNGAIQKSFAEIDLIREYRTRLVADVVTGQLDVRHLDLPEVEDTLVEAIELEERDELEEDAEPEEVEA